MHTTKVILMISSTMEWLFFDGGYFDERSRTSDSCKIRFGQRLAHPTICLRHNQWRCLENVGRALIKIIIKNNNNCEPYSHRIRTKAIVQTLRIRSI